jgi:hypothetical protein
MCNSCSTEAQDNQKKNKWRNNFENAREKIKGVGKLTYPLSANANALPVTPPSPPAGTTLMS